jgi:glycosyltransferase involved in cell wall biosynthesis
MEKQVIELSSVQPIFSIVMPIHNQEQIITGVIKRIFQHTVDLPYELICVIDACSDNTADVITTFFRTTPLPELLTQITLLISKIPLFETASDNVGARLARGKYFLEIQADIIIDEPGYNMKLLRPFLVLPNVIGVSGRCTHGLIEHTGIGKLGTAIESNLPYDINFTRFYVGETCNRGPLLIELAKLEELDYFDEDNFFLDNSDHDLFARAYAQKKWICGYVPIEITSNLRNGSTRKPRDSLNQEYYNKMINRPTTGGFLKTYIETVRNRPVRAVYSIDMYSAKSVLH